MRRKIIAGNWKMHGTRAGAAALQAGPWIAIERVFADIEIEGRKVSIHELHQTGEDALVVIDLVGLAHRAAQFPQLVQDVAFKLRHILVIDLLPILQAIQSTQHIAEGVAQFAIGFGVGLDDLRADANVIRII